MIELFKAENPNILRYIYEKLPLIPDIPQDQTAQRMLLQIAKNPDDTCIIVCFEDEKLKGFVYGYKTDFDWIYVELAWAEASLPDQYKREGFDKFCDWAQLKGIKKLRMETLRMNLKAWELLYGFKEYAVTMIKEL